MTQDVGAGAEPRRRGRRGRRRSRRSSLDIDGIETVQVSIGSSGSALRDAFSGGGSGITYSITTDPDADQVAVREEVRDAVAELDDVGDDHDRRRWRRVRLERHRDRRHRARRRRRCRTATDAVVDRRRRARTASARSPATSRRRCRTSPSASTATRPPRSGFARSPSARSSSQHDAAAADRLRRDRRHVAHRLPRGIADPPTTIDELRR